MAEKELELFYHFCAFIVKNVLKPSPGRRETANKKFKKRALA